MDSNGSNRRLNLETLVIGAQSNVKFIRKYLIYSFREWYRSCERFTRAYN